MVARRKDGCLFFARRRWCEIVALPIWSEEHGVYGNDVFGVFRFRRTILGVELLESTCFAMPCSHAPAIQIKTACCSPYLAYMRTIHFNFTRYLKHALLGLTDGASLFNFKGNYSLEARCCIHNLAGQFLSWLNKVPEAYCMVSGMAD